MLHDVLEVFLAQFRRATMIDIPAQHQLDVFPGWRSLSPEMLRHPEL